MSDTIKIIQDKVKIIVDEIRKSNLNKLNFIQIGAYDGVSYNDTANVCLLPTDKGIFIEPNYIIFPKLIENKKDFKNSKFMEIAIVPNDNFLLNDKFLLNEIGGTSSFIKYINDGNLYFPNFKWTKVKILTVKDFLSNNVDFNVDLLFMDCEGYDHDLVFEFLKYIEPKVIFFESWNTESINNRETDILLKTRDEIINYLISKGYKTEFFEVDENILSYKI